MTHNLHCRSLIILASYLRKDLLKRSPMRGEKQLVLPVHTAGNISHLITNCKPVQVPTTPLFCLCSSEGMKGCLTQQSPAMCTQNSKGTHVTYVHTQVGGKQLNISRRARQVKMMICLESMSSYQGNSFLLRFTQQLPRLCLGPLTF